MPVMKIGQASHNEVSKLEQQHFDLNMKIRDILDTIPLDVKARLVTKLPGVIDEIDAEMKASDQNIGG